MIEVETVFDFESTQALTKHMLKKFWFVPYAISLLLIVIGVVWFFNEEDLVMRITFLVIFSIFGVLFKPLISYANKKNNQNQAKTYSLLNKETINYFKFDNDQFYVKTVKGDAFRGETGGLYSELFKAVETDAYFFVFLNAAQAYCVPKKDIITGTAAELSELLKNKFGDKFKRAVKK